MFICFQYDLLFITFFLQCYYEIMENGKFSSNTTPAILYKLVYANIFSCKSRISELINILYIINRNNLMCQRIKFYVIFGQGIGSLGILA